METKRCTRCKETRPTTDFGKDPKMKRGFKSNCLICARAAHKKWYDKNIETVRQKAREYGKTEKCQQDRKHRYHTDKAYRLKRRQQCWQSKQKESSRQKNREWQRKQRETDPTYKLRINLARRIRDAMVLNRKSLPTMLLTGCSIDELRAHLERQWLPGMSWINYSVHGWHIDHIVPCSAFDLSNPEEQKRCFHYTNLQPLWAIDNWRKSDYVPDYQI